MRISRIPAAVLGLLLCATATAQGTNGLRLSLSIEAQPLRTALRAFESQSGLQVSYREEDVATAGVMAPRVAGDMEAEEALRLLLSGTGLKFEFINPRLVRVSSASEEAPKSKVLAEEKPTAMPEDDGPRRIRLAQADKATTSETEFPLSGGAPSATSAAVPEVLVEGSRLLNMDIRRTEDDMQPYVIFSRDTIEQSGASNIQDFIKTRLPMATNANAPAQGLSNLGGVSSINLRGLGTNQTLVLIDGHRAAGINLNGNPQQPDLNGIPLSAVERIEVLPATASGIYGGGATGGVINVILRRDYTGAEAEVTYGDTLDGGGTSYRISLNSGFSLEGGRTSVLLAASYAKTGPLLVGERDYAQDARNTMLANNPGFFFGPSASPPVGATTNIRSNAPLVGGQRPNLTLKGSNQSLNSPYTFVPLGYEGNDGGAALLANAGQYNLDLPQNAQGANASLLNEPKVESLITTVRREFLDNLQGFLELAASNNTGRFRTNRANATFTLPANAPNNPFNEPIIVTTPIFGADATAVSTVYSRRAVAGLIWQISRDWQLVTDYTWNRVRFSSLTPNGITTAAGTAVNSGEINVMRDTNLFPVDFEAFLEPPTVTEPTHSVMRDATVRVAGSLVELPAGPLTLTTMVEYRTEKFDWTISRNATSRTDFPDRSQSAKSVYLEAKIPIFSGKNRVPGVELLEVQLAGRRDEYTVNGSNSLTSPTQVVQRYTRELSSTDPTFGLRWKPVRDVMLRFSYGTGFLPPAVTQLVPSAPVTIPASTAASLSVRDPLRGNEPLGAFTANGGGSPDLKPEESTSKSIGAVFTPRFVEGLRLSFDWTRIDKTDGITSFGFNQDAINNEALIPGLIVRGPVTPGDPFGVGRVVEFNAPRLYNIAQLNVEAYDVSINYTLSTGRFGSLGFDLNGTRLMHLETQITPSSPLVENVGVSNATVNPGNVGGGLRWKGNASINWIHGSWGLGWNTSYYDSYWLNLAHTVNINQGAAKVPKQIFHDMYVSWSAPENVRGILEKTRVRLGITNVFNTKPEQDLVGTTAAFNPLGYSYWADPRRASYYLTLAKGF